MNVSIIDKSPYYDFSSQSSHVPSQYLYAGINCLAFRALSYEDKDFILQREFDKIRTSASKGSLSKSKVDNILIDKQKKNSNKVIFLTVIMLLILKILILKDMYCCPILMLSLQRMF